MAKESWFSSSKNKRDAGIAALALTAVAGLVTGIAGIIVHQNKKKEKESWGKKKKG